MSAPGNIRRLRSGAKDNWCTPKPLFSAIQRKLGVWFDVDMAADDENALRSHYFTEEDNALEQPWPLYKWLWCNPPYSLTKEFVTKAIVESAVCRSVLLVPASTDTRWWAEAFDAADVTLLLTGRVSFVDPVTERPMSGNTTGSTIFVFGESVFGELSNKGVHMWDWKKDLSR